MVVLDENGNTNSFLWNIRKKFRREHLSNGGDVVQGHGVQMLVSALEEKLQRWEQQGLV